MPVFECRIAALAAIAMSCACASEPWDSPFADDIPAIIQASSKITSKDKPVVVLLDEYLYTVHPDGRTDATFRRVYRIDQSEAIEDWSAVEQEYQPWYQLKPEIRARVIGSAGAVHLLDVNTIADAPARQFESSIFSDSRVLRAPLPSLAPGSIVEYQIVSRDKAPLLDAGVTRRITINDAIPLQRFHARIEGEPGSSVRIAKGLLPEGAIREETIKQGTRVELELGPLNARKNFEFNLPPDDAPSPYLSFSTGQSWQAVATRYEGIVNERIRSSDLKSLLSSLIAGSAPREKVSKLVAALHKNVRYTGVEFGEAAIVPATPDEVLRRGYGDCKDKSALLVALLRGAGMEADVALLSSGFGMDVNANLPGLGLFNHAIVYVETDPPLWIDATASETRVGFLPAADQGRLALIANRQTMALTKTPEATSRDNWQRHTIEVRMSEFGPGNFTETLEAGGGLMESRLRSTYGGDEKKLKEQLDVYVKGMFAAKSAGLFEVTAKDSMDGPFRLSVEAKQSPLSSTGQDDAGVALTPWLVFEEMAYALRSLDAFADDTDSTDDKKTRVHDFVFPEAFVSEYRYKITPPRFFKVSTQPASAEIKLGPAAFSRSYKSNPDGTFEAIFRLDTGKRRLTALEFAALRDGLKEQDKRVPEVIAFLPETSEYVATGQTGKALALLRESVTKNPESAIAHARLSHLLLVGSLGGAARAEAQRATELDPKSGLAWQALAWAFQHDTFGRRMKGNWSSSEAEKFYRKALELDSEDLTTKTNLAILLEHNAEGWRYGPGARMEEAIALYRELLKKQPTPVLEQNLAVALLRAGQLPAAKEEARKCAPDFQSTFLAAIATVQEGAARVIMNAQSSFPDPQQRAMHLFSVAATLLQMRRYDLATVIAKASARLANLQEIHARAEVFSKLKRSEDQMLPETDPSATVQQLLMTALNGKLTLEEFRKLSSRRLDPVNLAAALEFFQASVGSARNNLSYGDLPDDVAVDWMLSFASYEKDGDEANGFRIRALTSGVVHAPALYVIPENGHYRLLGVAPDSLESIGRLVLKLVEDNAIPQAQWWLDRIVSAAEPNADGTGLPAVHSLWSGTTTELRGAAAIRIAAASLFGSGEGASIAMQILEPARVKAGTALEKSQIDKALCEVLRRASKWNDLLPAAKRLENSKTFPEEGFRYVVAATSGAKKWKELELEAQQRLTGNPLNNAAMRALVLARLRQNNMPGAVSVFEKLKPSRIVVNVKKGGGVSPATSTPDDHILSAWATMLNGKANAEALDKLKKEKEGAGSYPGFQLTLALMQVLADAPDDATQSLLATINNQDYFRLGPTTWVTYGEICKRYGFQTEADEAFARARKAANRSDEFGDWALALIPAAAQQ